MSESQTKCGNRDSVVQLCVRCIQLNRKVCKGRDRNSREEREQEVKERDVRETEIWSV